jgi:hypothetical protein
VDEDCEVIGVDTVVQADIRVWLASVVYPGDLEVVIHMMMTMTMTMTMVILFCAHSKMMLTSAVQE